MSNGASGVDVRTRTTAVALTDVDITFRWPTAAPMRRWSALRSMSPTANSSPSSARPAAANQRCSMSPRACSAVARPGEDFRHNPRGPEPAVRLPVPVDSLFPWKTALENVAIGLETAGTPREARGRAQEWLTRVGLGAFGRAIRTCCPAASGSASASPRC